MLVCEAGVLWPECSACVGGGGRGSGTVVT